MARTPTRTPRKEKRKRGNEESKEDIEEALLENERVNATPLEPEDRKSKSRRQQRRRSLRYRLNKKLTALFAAEDAEATRSTVNRERISGGASQAEDEGKQEDDDPDEVIARARVREEAALQESIRLLSLEEEGRQEARFRKSQIEARRRANMSEDQRQFERARQTSTQAYRRANMTERQRQEERERHTELEAGRRADLTEQERQEERERHTELEANRRANLTEQERQDMRERHTDLVASLRANMSEQQREAERAQHAVLEAQRVASLTAEAAAAAKERRRIRLATRRYQHALGNHELFTVSQVTGTDVVGGRHTLPEPTVVCRHCQAWKWPGESEFSCCMKGLVKIDPLHPAPRELRDLFQDKEFRKNIRSYNQVMAFTSVGAACDQNGFHRVREDTSVQGQRGIFTYRIQGAMGHFLGSLLPSTDENGQLKPPTFAQIYIFDPDMEARVARRQGIYGGLDTAALVTLEHVMEDYNPFARQYLRMGEVLRGMIEAGHHPVDVSFRLHANDRAGRGTHNLPVQSEVAAVMIEDGNGANNRDLLLRSRSHGLMRLYETWPQYDPLQYPLLFPHGESGWTYTLEYANGQEYRGKKKMALREFVASRLFPKVTEQTLLQDGGRLFQQYVVDQRAKCEQENLRWVASHQKDIRADLYKGVADAYFNADAEQHNSDARVVSDQPRHFLEQVGQRVVLPASYTGGDRYMHAQYLDSMAMVRELGKPDLFMTVTCNPLWDEIVNAVGPGRTAQDRPDIVARVWQQKLKAVLQDLDDGVLGHQIARIYVIEFQKR